jgi:hypothetical protein
MFRLSVLRQCGCCARGFWSNGDICTGHQSLHICHHDLRLVQTFSLLKLQVRQSASDPAAPAAGFRPASTQHDRMPQPPSTFLGLPGLDEGDEDAALLAAMEAAASEMAVAFAACKLALHPPHQPTGHSLPHRAPLHPPQQQQHRTSTSPTSSSSFTSQHNGQRQHRLGTVTTPSLGAADAQQRQVQPHRLSSSSVTGCHPPSTQVRKIQVCGT